MTIYPKKLQFAAYGQFDLVLKLNRMLAVKGIQHFLDYIFLIAGRTKVSRSVPYFQEVLFNFI